MCSPKKEVGESGAIRFQKTQKNLFLNQKWINQYQKINGHFIGTYGEAICHHCDGDFVHGKFYLKEVEYNPYNL